MLDGRVGGVGVCEGRGETPDWPTVRAGKQQTTWRPASADWVLFDFRILYDLIVILLSSYPHDKLLYKANICLGKITRSLRVYWSGLPSPHSAQHGQDTGRRITFSSPALNNREEDGE